MFENHDAISYIPKIFSFSYTGVPIVLSLKSVYFTTTVVSNISLIFLSQSILFNATKLIFLKYQCEYIITLLKNCCTVAHIMKSELLTLTNRRQIMADFQLPCKSYLRTSCEINPSHMVLLTDHWTCQHTSVFTILLTPSFLPNKPVSTISIYINPNFPSKPSFIYLANYFTVQGTILDERNLKILTQSAQ